MPTLTVRPLPAGFRRLATYLIRLGPDSSPVRLGRFGRLAVVHACSSAGDTLVVVALAGSLFVSVPLHAARGRTALGLACTVLPFIVVGPFIGPLMDRVQGGQRFMVWLSAVGRAGTCVLMAFWVHSFWLFPAAFLSLVCSKTYLVGKAALVPSVVDRQAELVEANAKLAVGSSVVTSVAVLGGGAALKTFGSAAILYVDAVLFAVCAWQALRLPAPPTGGWVPGRAAADGAPVVSPLVAAEDLDGPGTFPAGGLPLASAFMATVRGMAGLMTALVAFGFRHDHAPLIWYGIVGVSGVAGTLIGAAVAPWFRRHLREHHIMVVCAFAMGAVALAVTEIGVAHLRPSAVVLAFVVALGGAVAKVACDALVQRDAPSAARSRLLGYYEGVCQLGWVLAALVPTLVPLSLAAGFLTIAGVMLAGTGMFVWGTAWMRQRQTRAWAPAVGTPLLAPAGGVAEGAGG